MAVLRHSASAKGNRGTVILIVFLVLMASCRFAAEGQNTNVTGVVKNLAGEPVAGALVKVRSADLGLGFMVVSQAQGRYSTPHLLAGKYTVQAFGGDYQSDLAGPVEVSSGQQEKMDLVLSALRKITPPPEDPMYHPTMTTADYAELMPEGAAKRLLLTRCVLCHGLERIVPRRYTREEWAKIVDRMRDFLQDHRVPVSGQERDTMVDYVAKHFGPDTPPLRREQAPAPDPNANLPRTLLAGMEAKFVAMEFYLERGTWIHHLAVDPQGVAWFSETNVGMLGSFDPKSFTYTRITPPREKSLGAVRVDPQGHVWFTTRHFDDSDLNGVLFQYNPKSQEFNSYDIPVPPGLRPNMNTLRFLDGKVWGTGITSSKILKLDPSTAKWSDFPVPKGSLPYGLAIGGDKMIWCASSFGNEVVRLDPGSGKLTHYKVPTPKSGLRQMQADAEGNLWVAGQQSGKLLKVDYRTGEVTELAPPTEGSGPFSLDVDTTRNLIWFGEMSAGKLGRYDPRTNSFVEFPLPSLPSADSSSDAPFDSGVIWIEVDRSNPNRVWWGAGSNARIGYIEVME